MSFYTYQFGLTHVECKYIYQLLFRNEPLNRQEERLRITAAQTIVAAMCDVVALPRDGDDFDFAEMRDMMVNFLSIAVKHEKSFKPILTLIQSVVPNTSVGALIQRITDPDWRDFYTYSTAMAGTKEPTKDIVNRRLQAVYESNPHSFDSEIRKHLHNIGRDVDNIDEKSCALLESFLPDVSQYRQLSGRSTGVLYCLIQRGDNEIISRVFDPTVTIHTEAMQQCFTMFGEEVSLALHVALFNTEVNTTFTATVTYLAAMFLLKMNPDTLNVTCQDELLANIMFYLENSITDRSVTSIVSLFVGANELNYLRSLDPELKCSLTATKTEDKPILPFASFTIS